MYFLPGNFIIFAIRVSIDFVLQVMGHVFPALSYV